LLRHIAEVISDYARAALLAMAGGAALLLIISATRKHSYEAALIVESVTVLGFIFLEYRAAIQVRNQVREMSKEIARLNKEEMLKRLRGEMIGKISALSDVEVQEFDREVHEEFRRILISEALILAEKGFLHPSVFRPLIGLPEPISWEEKILLKLRRILLIESQPKPVS
jgi:hypothetical protein